MVRATSFVAAAALLVLLARAAHADAHPASRDLQAAVDAYVGAADAGTTWVGGPGRVGYDAGFWLRGGDFTLRVNLTLQARYEYFDWNDVNEERSPGGDLSGFSLPRATLKLSGEAPCTTRYYLDLELGHDGFGLFDTPEPVNSLIFTRQSYNFDTAREAWIEYGFSDAFNIRMGQIQTPSTRQLMVAPELQQFVDVSMASAITGVLLPGYTDRNRDFGVMFDGSLGCDNEVAYMLAVTNGEGGDSLRNVLDPFTSDNLAYSARVNWAFLNPIGYQEGATRQMTCTWYGEVGVWAHTYADRIDKPHRSVYDRLAVGGDVALGHGGWSFTGAISWFDASGSDLGDADESWTIWLAQLGYLFPETAWELAARWSHTTRDVQGIGRPETDELAAAVSYYLNGHGNKLTLDVSWITASADGPAAGAGGGYYDTYAGVPMGFVSNDDGLLVRFQWQLAL
jgi:hypothetical protein